ncbi:MAG: multidrug ABC transporter ATP-binding protein, partial [Ketobacter sp.]
MASGNTITMLSLFERIIRPFPSATPDTPPAGLFRFILHYSKGMHWPLLAMSILTAINAFLEVQLFNFLGQLVD